MIVSDGTKQRLNGIACRELDLVRVKGKNEPVAIFEPVGPADSLPDAEKQALADFSAAIAAYRRQEWDTAQTLLNKMRQVEDRPIYNVYLKRIGQFRGEPPPPDWDGVFEHLTK